jgi:hypothetical protein
LLERRVKAGPAAETRPRLKIIISVAFAGFFALLIVSVLDHRFGASSVPAWISVIGNALVPAARPAIGRPMRASVRPRRSGTGSPGLTQRDRGPSPSTKISLTRVSFGSKFCGGEHPWHRDEQLQQGAIANLLQKGAQLFTPIQSTRLIGPLPRARISRERPIATDWKYSEVPYCKRRAG